MEEMQELNAATRLCAVIGNPVNHSLSPAMHNAAFQAYQLNYAYLAFEVSDLAGFFTGMRAIPSFRGLSITIPHKVAALKLMDEVDEMAQKVGCINTVTQDKGKLIGTVTDGLGALRAFQDANVELAGSNVVFLGAGGAVRAVAFAMADEAKVKKITILGRSPEKVALLVNDLKQGTDSEINSGDLVVDLSKAMNTHDVIVQGTPMGMHPNNVDSSPVPPDLLNKRHIVFDMVYRPQHTRLLQDAENAGSTTIPGLEMLVNQAQLQFEAWTGKSAPRDVMRGALMKCL